MEKVITRESCSNNKTLCEKQATLRKASQALVEYIRKYETPMTTVIVTGVGVEVLSTESHILFNDEWD